MEKIRNTLSRTDLSSVAAQLSMLLKGGVNVGEAMELVTENSPSQKGVLKEVTEGVLAGDALADCFDKSGRFPDYFVEMVRIGEGTGRLDEVLDSLNAYYEKSEEISRNVRSVLTYPAILMAVLLIILCIICAKVLPIFERVYIQLGASMPGVITSLIAFGEFLNNNMVLIISAITVIAAVVIYATNTSKGRKSSADMIEKSIFTRSIANQSSTGRFATAVSLCLSSGLNTDEAVDMAEKLVESKALSKKIAQMREMTAKGMTFSEALEKSGIFSSLYTGMLEVGRRTGLLDDMMKAVADNYIKESDRRTEQAISVIEPTVVIIISVIIGILLLCVMLPLIEIMTAL